MISELLLELGLCMFRVRLAEVSPLDFSPLPFPRF